MQLNDEEQKYLRTFLQEGYAAETRQVDDLITNCDNKYQFAKTHSQYVKDWEAMKAQMTNRIVTNDLPPGISQDLLKAMVQGLDKIMDQKLKKVQDAFQHKFHDSIFNGYIGKDGKTKKLFGIFG